MPETYFCVWNGLEIMLHVSTFMTAEQQRRLIGNDIGLIFYQEDAAFRVAMRGNVNSVAMVVSPSAPFDEAQSYQIGTFRRGNIRSFDPPLPERPVLEAAALRDFVFTKMINGTLAAHRSPPLSTLHARVWKAALEDLTKSLVA